MKKKFIWIQIVVLAAVMTLILLDFETCENNTTHTHTLGRAATCETPQTCTECGILINDENGHTWSDWDEDAVEETCIHPSYDTRYCTSEDCGVDEKRPGSYSALGHNLPGAFAATCVSEGYTGIGHCDRCGEDETGVPIPIDPEDHDYSGTPVITLATCTTDGNEAIPCGNDGCNIEHVTVLHALGHDYDNAVWTVSKTASYCVSSTNHGNGEEELRCERYSACGYKDTRLTPCLGTQGLAFSPASTADMSSMKSTSVVSVCIPDYNGTTHVTAISGNDTVNTAITSVRIGANVTSIGTYAFYSCSGLTSVTIPNSVTSIGESAFSFCSGLTSVTIPNSVTSIGIGTFYYCSGLTSVTIGNGVTSIGQNAFLSCSKLTSVTIPDSVTSIGYNAFRFCNSLTSVTFQRADTTMGYTNFPGDLRAKYLAGGIGTYNRTSGSDDNAVWTKQ